MYVVGVYLALLAISIGPTIWVAQTLMKNGRVFLVDTFLENERLADSVNRLLVVGFYLINIGYVSLAHYRAWSLRLARPVLLPLARQAFALLSQNRGRISRWLQLASEKARCHAPYGRLRYACTISTSART